MINRTTLAFWLITLFIITNAKTSLASEFNVTHNAHDETGFEFGISVGYVYLKEEKDEGTAVHAHLMKRLSDEGFQRFFSVGFGVETIFTKEKHYGAMVTVAVHPWDNTVFSVSPGIEWEEHEGETKSGYATHIEAAYVFEASHYHLGPVVGYSKTEDDEHYTIGVHLGMPL